MTDGVQAAGLEQSLETARAGRAQAERELFDFLGIPSISALSEHDADVRRACSWVADYLRRIGMEVEVDDSLGKPVVAAEWLGRPGAPVLTIYGHYDVQPPDPLEEWLTPPFEPAVRDGFVYARGASDDKGQLLADIKAVEYAFAAGGPPLNLRFLIEGEEEISGDSLPKFVETNAARLHTDYLLITDAGFEAPGLPALMTVLRGLVYTEIEVVGARADLHSGRFGGVAPNPLNSLAHILAALKDREGRIHIPGFYERVRAPAPKEIESWSRLPTNEETFRRAMGVQSLEGEAGYTVQERLGSRPTLDVHGIIGGFTGEGAKTVIPARAKAKVSMRLVPDQDPKEVFTAFRGFVESLATPGVRVSVREVSHGAPPVVLGVDHPGLEAAGRAYKTAFGTEPVMTRESGSIPVTKMFQDALNPAIVVTGFGLPDDGLHSPNEHFSLDHFHRGTEMVLHFMQNLAFGSSSR